MAYHVKTNGYAGLAKDGTSKYYVDVMVDTAADIPDPAEHPEWEIGSELVVLENGGSKYQLSNAREWVQVNFNSGGGGDSAKLQEELDKAKAMVDGMIDRSITEIESNASSIGASTFSGCSKLVSAIFYEATKIGNSAFKSTSMLDTAVFYKATTIGSAVFESSKIKTLDIHTYCTCEEKNAFTYSSSLQTLILRASQVCGYLGRLGYISTPYGDELCPIEQGTGYIYVPRSVLSAYKSHSEWGRYTSQFRALEDYTVDGTITGELDETKI